MKNAVLFWSAGKDSAMALQRVLNDPEISLGALVTTLNQEYGRISMHGIREALLERQAAATGIPLVKMWVPNEPTNTAYEQVLINTYRQLKSDGIDLVIFGDIFLEDLRSYREKLLDDCGLEGYFPLWQQPTQALLSDFVTDGFKAVTCCISTAYLDETWLNRQLDETFIKTLPITVDPCGENGEFHTFCYAGPVFQSEIHYSAGQKRFHPLKLKTSYSNELTGFWYIDLV